jgi:hypothetical protein
MFHRTGHADNASSERCDDLGLLGDDESRVRSLWIKYRNAWQEIEEDGLALEEPQLMKNSVDVLFESGVISKAQMLYELPFARTDIERMLNLLDGYLAADHGKVTNFPTLKVKPGGQFSGGAEIINIKDRSKS